MHINSNEIIHIVPAVVGKSDFVEAVILSSKAIIGAPIIEWSCLIPLSYDVKSIIWSKTGGSFPPKFVVPTLVLILLSNGALLSEPKSNSGAGWDRALLLFFLKRSE